MSGFSVDCRLTITGGIRAEIAGLEERMSWRCKQCGKVNDGNLSRCECGHKWSIGDSSGAQAPSLPSWVKIASAVVFPLCMFAGFVYMKRASPDSACAGPFGLVAGAAAGVFIIGVLAVLWILLIHIAERQWVRIKPLIAVLAGLGVVAAAGYCVVRWNGVFGGWILAGGVSLIIFCVQSLARGKYDVKSGENAVRDVGLVIIGLTVCVFAVMLLRSAWMEQYEKTGKRWYVSVLMSGPDEDRMEH